MNDRELLNHVGKITHQKATNKARAEYDMFDALQINVPSLVEQHFFEAIKVVQQIESERNK